ncbi:MAG: hypothetical protein C4525_08885 [Desulfarculus sp.]|jgi:hypothetical protein|nr:MAG: hypothetical protein C4525_08885 [Desulfarculus sp.]
MVTRPGDIVLIHRQGEAIAFARVEQITADVKPQWWQIELLFLMVPPQSATWILRQEYIDGGEFSMGGDTMRLERLPEPAGQQAPRPEPPAGPVPGGEGDKVVSLSRRRQDK